jgi:hypothetical protein
VFAEPVSPGAGVRVQPVVHFMMGEVGKVTMGDALVVGDELFLPVSTEILERTRTTTIEHWLLCYDGAGRLAVAVIVGREQEEHGYMLENPRPEDFTTTETPGESFELIRFRRDAAGKIAGVEGRQGAVRCEPTWMDAGAEETDGRCAFRVWSWRAAP